MSEIIELVKIAGPLAAMVIFFVYRDYMRENRLSKRLDELEEYIRTQLKDIAEKNQKVIADNSLSNRELRSVMDLRPCLHGKVKV